MPWKVIGFMHPNAVRHEQYGPLPRKRWIKGPWRLKYRTPSLTTLIGTPTDINEYRAIEYAKWLAARDGLVIAAGERWGTKKPRVEWSHFRSEISNKFLKRVRSVRFPCGTRINIPHWDWEPSEPTEETVSLPMRQLRKTAKTQRRRAA